MTLDRMCPNLTYQPIISRPQEEAAQWAGATGYIQDLWESMPLEDSWGFRPSPDNTHIFVCGNPGMVENMTEILGRQGFREHKKRDPGQVHVERYW